MNGDAPLRRSTILLYALPALVSSVAALPMALFVPAFYASDLGLPLASVGIALAASRLLDVVTDPVIGGLSDRWATRFGRRRVWMAVGAPVFVLGLWKVFVPGEGATAWSLGAWAALLYLGFTLLDLPHKAWGAELSDRYDERSRIAGWREGLAAAGQVALLVALWLGARAGWGAPADQLWGLAVAVAVGLPVLLLASFAAGERPAVRSAQRLGIVAGVRLVVRNPAFLRVVASTVLFVTGIAIQGTLHQLVLRDVMAAPDWFVPMILAENVATLAAVPLWLAVATRLDKPRALMAAAAWLAVWSAPLAVLREGDAGWMVALMVVRGSSFASVLFLASALAADVIDLDTLASGTQRSGVFFAIQGMATKLSLAFGVLLGTALPAALGYVPGALATPVVAGRVMAVYGLLPAVLMGAGAAFLVGFPVTRAVHAAVRAQLDRGAGG